MRQHCKYENNKTKARQMETFRSPSRQIVQRLVKGEREREACPVRGRQTWLESAKRANEAARTCGSGKWSAPSPESCSSCPLAVVLPHFLVQKPPKQNDALLVFSSYEKTEVEKRQGRFPQMILWGQQGQTILLKKTGKGSISLIGIFFTLPG